MHWCCLELCRVRKFRCLLQTLKGRPGDGPREKDAHLWTFQSKLCPRAGGGKVDRPDRATINVKQLLTQSTDRPTDRVLHLLLDYPDNLPDLEPAKNAKEGINVLYVCILWRIRSLCHSSQARASAVRMEKWQGDNDGKNQRSYGLCMY